MVPRHHNYFTKPHFVPNWIQIQFNYKSNYYLSKQRDKNVRGVANNLQILSCRYQLKLDFNFGPSNILTGQQHLIWSFKLQLLVLHFPNHMNLCVWTYANALDLCAKFHDEHNSFSKNINYKTLQKRLYRK